MFKQAALSSGCEAGFCSDDDPPGLPGDERPRGCDCWLCRRGPAPFRWKRHKFHRCRCHRHPRGRPKVPTSLCRGGVNYQPPVRERIEGKRLCRAWCRAVRGIFRYDDVWLRASYRR